MTEIFFVPRHRETRESHLIKQGIENNPGTRFCRRSHRADFIFQFYFVPRNAAFYCQSYPAEKTVVLDYHDFSHFHLPLGCLAYFKRSWPSPIRQGKYIVKEIIDRPSNYHPISMAILDEFILDEDLERDYTLSCTLRAGKHHNREKVLGIVSSININGKFHIGDYTPRGTMMRFNGPDMKKYFRLLKRSKIIVTCNPDKWEGDHRTWEALAAGALVFVDRMLTPLVHPLIDGKHCIFYEMSDAGLQEMKEKIEYFIRNPGQARTIAMTGHDFAMKYHRSTNRIDEILEVIT